MYAWLTIVNISHDAIKFPSEEINLNVEEREFPIPPPFSHCAVA